MREMGWTKLSGLVVVGLLVAGSGCKPTPGYYPNQDPALRKPVTAYRADSAGRVYPAEAPRVKGLAARSQIGYMAKRVDVANLSTEDFQNLEVWVNGKYVCYLPKIEKGVLKSIPFDALFDREGQHVPSDSRTFVVETVEIYMGGKLYDLVVQIAY